MKPTLIAAVGGTGASAAKQAKLRFDQFVGPRRHYAAIRAFDTDYQDDRTPRLVAHAEHVYLGGFNAQSVIQDVIAGREEFRHYAKWLPPWLSFQQVAVGAGGIRPIGRLCYFYQRERIKGAVTEALTGSRTMRRR
ncbi:MAG: tubulin-like doman-containing protein [Bryobacteraceae bacterium]